MNLSERRAAHIAKSYGVDLEKIALNDLIKAKMHKYIRIENGKYIYDHDKMTANDHKFESERHRNNAKKLRDDMKNGDQLAKKTLADQFDKEADTHEKLAQEIAEKEITEKYKHWKPEDHRKEIENRKKAMSFLEKQDIDKDHPMYKQHENAIKHHERMIKEKENK